MRGYRQCRHKESVNQVQTRFVHRRSQCRLQTQANFLCARRACVRQRSIPIALLTCELLLLKVALFLCPFLLPLPPSDELIISKLICAPRSLYLLRTKITHKILQESPVDAPLVAKWKCLAASRHRQTSKKRSSVCARVNFILAAAAFFTGCVILTRRMVIADAANGRCQNLIDRASAPILLYTAHCPRKCF